MRIQRGANKERIKARATPWKLRLKVGQLPRALLYAKPAASSREPRGKPPKALARDPLLLPISAECAKIMHLELSLLRLYLKHENANEG